MDSRATSLEESNVSFNIPARFEEPQRAKIVPLAHLEKTEGLGWPCNWTTYGSQKVGSWGAGPALKAIRTAV